MTSDEVGLRPRARRGDDLLYVQYLRGIAAILVIYFHTKVYNPNFEWHVDRSIGYGGVDLFFCISGFIMTRTTAQRHIGVSTFLMKRILRIYPLYWFATLVGVALFLGLPSVFMKQSITPDFILYSLLLLPFQDSSGTSNGVPFLKVGWTLVLEMYFYAVVASSLLSRSVARRFAIQAVIIGGMCLIGIAFHPTSAPMLFYTGPIALEFILGSAVGLLAGSNRLESIPKAAVVALLVAGVVLFLLGGGHGDGFARVVFFGIPSALILAAFVIAEMRYGTRYRSRWLLLLGNASYAIYLFHPFVLSFMRAVVAKLIPAGGPYLGAACVIASVAAAVGVGVVIHLAIEQRLNTAAKAIVAPWIPTRSAGAMAKPQGPQA